MESELHLYASVRGDWSVGIPSTTFTVENIGEIEPEFRDEVRAAFGKAFALLTDMPVDITFSDERDFDGEDSE